MLFHYPSLSRTLWSG